MTIINQINNLAKNLDVSMNVPLMRCVECGKHLPIIQNEISKHFLEFHARERKINQGKAWKFDSTFMPKVVKY